MIGDVLGGIFDIWLGLLLLSALFCGLSSMGGGTYYPLPPPREIADTLSKETISKIASSVAQMLLLIVGLILHTIIFG